MKNEAVELSVEHKLMEKHIKKLGLIATVISVVVSVLAVLGVTYGFYYTTKNDIQTNSIDIEEVKSNQNDIIDALQDIQIYKGVSKESIIGIKGGMEKMDKKLDLILTKL